MTIRTHEVENRVGTTAAVVIMAVMLFSLVVTAAPADDSIDLNRYYRFPVSFGAGYDLLTPLVDYPVRYTLYGFSATVRVPVPAIPILQPTLTVGTMTFAAGETDDSQWENRHLYTAGGITVAHRFAKAFEISGEALAGVTHAVFPNLPEGPQGLSSLLLQAGARITVSPGFNLAIDVHPHLRYLRSSVPYFRELDGPVFGLGLSAHWRLGQDPDAPTATIRSLQFSQVDLSRVFAAMQSYYLEHPVGSLTIANADRHRITDLHIAFHQPAFMDSPTTCASIDELEPGASKTVDLFAVFNQEVFRTEGTIPLTGEVIASYRTQGRPVEQRFPISFDLYDKTALVWDDDRKAAALVTPADSALRNYGAFIRRVGVKTERPGVPEPLQTAIRTYHALVELGVVYQSDPVLPFARAQGNVEFVDSVCLPRDALLRGAGDCDDLTVLYAALLEAVGIEAGFITIPGHIYPAVNTKVPASRARTVHPDPAMTLIVNDEVWVPVEITLLGRGSFLDAWRTGAAQYAEYDEAPDHRQFIVVREAQQVYRPVGLRESDLGLQYGQADAILTRFERDMADISSAALAHAGRIASERGRAADYNRLGIEAARYGQLGEAEASFRRALAIDPLSIEAIVNLGSLQHLNGDHRSAIRTLNDAATQLKEALAAGTVSPRTAALEAGINATLSRSYAAIEDHDRAALHLARVPALEPADAGSRSDPGGRASDTPATSFDSMFFSGPEE